MATARVVTNQEPSWYVWARTVVVGLAVAVTYGALTYIIQKYVVDPLACSGGNPAQCVQSASISANISMVLAALAGLGLSIRFGFARPLFVVLLATALLWGIADWTSGLFWLEAFGWTLLIFTAAYVLSGWIARQANILAALIVAVVIFALERILLAL